MPSHLPLETPPAAARRTPLLGLVLPLVLLPALAGPAVGQTTPSPPQDAFGTAIGYDSIQSLYRSLVPIASADSSLTEDVGLGGLTVDQTLTRIGREFYDLFYRIWSTTDQKGNFSIIIEEFPLPGAGTGISVRVDGELVFRTRLSPRGDNTQPAARAAFRYVQRQIERGSSEPTSY